METELSSARKTAEVSWQDLETGSKNVIVAWVKAPLPAVIGVIGVIGVLAVRSLA